MGQALWRNSHRKAATISNKKSHSICHGLILSDVVRFWEPATSCKCAEQSDCMDLQSETVTSAPFGRFYYGPEAKEFESLLSALSTGEISLEDLIELTSGSVELSLMDKKNKEEVNVSTHVLTYQGKVRKVHIKNRTVELINEKIRNRKEAIQNHKEIEEEIENLRRERFNDLKINQMKQVMKYRIRERERER